MNEDRLRELVAEYGFSGDDARRALMLARDIERETSNEYFQLIQCANNAANARDVTPRQLDKMIYDASIWGG